MNIKVAQRTTQKYRHADRSIPPAGQSCSTFLKTDRKDIWACDFVAVVSLFFKSISAFAIVHHESRRVVHLGVTERPTDEWITPPWREAMSFDEKSKYWICDNDKRYGEGFERSPKAPRIEVIYTPYEAPWANAIGERIAGSLRRECLEHVLVIGVLPLMRLLKEYVSYSNQAWPHWGIGQRIPEARQSPLGEPKTRKVIAFPVLNGLHHDYRWAAKAIGSQKRGWMKGIASTG